MNLNPLTVQIKSITHITHDVLQIVTDKPENFLFTPGQATKISINTNEWKDEKRSFTFTSLPEDPYLEFTIKTYPEKKGVTNELLRLKAGDELILHAVFGTIAYRGEGIFIAGGAGITPFIAIFRDLQSKNKTGINKLIFANKTSEDIILREEFIKMLDTNFINILSDDPGSDYAHGQISEAFMRANCDTMNRLFYVCGPPPMMEAIELLLKNMGVKSTSIIKETF